MGVRFDEIELFKGPDDPNTDSPRAAAPQRPLAVPAPPRPSTPRRAVPLKPAAPVKPAAIPPAEAAPDSAQTTPAVRASRWRRMLTFGTDMSLFVALALALSPLLPSRGDWVTTLQQDWLTILAFGAFVLLLSFYYFVPSWTVWGKTIGGAIFDLRVGAEDGGAITFRSAARRWAGTLAGLATLGGGFVIALLPGAKSLPDRLSSSRCFVAR